LRDGGTLALVEFPAWIGRVTLAPRLATASRRDIDDTVDVVHGHQQLSLFNAHYDERCFLPLHIYDTITGRPVAGCCGRARRRRDGRSSVFCGGSFGASAGVGRQPGSRLRGDSH